MADKRYIECGALINKIFPIGLIDDGRYVIPAKAVKSAIDKAPTVDAVPVVRCKDCRFCKKHPTSDKTKMCTNEQQWVTDCYPLVHDTDFCSYGERKEK